MLLLPLPLDSAGAPGPEPVEDSGAVSGLIVHLSLLIVPELVVLKLLLKSSSYRKGVRFSFKPYVSLHNHVTYSHISIAIYSIDLLISVTLNLFSLLSY